MKRILHQLRLVVHLINYLKGSIIHPRWWFGICFHQQEMTQVVFPDRSPRWLYFSVSRLPKGGTDHLLHSSVAPASSTGRTNWNASVSPKAMSKEKSHFKIAGETSNKKHKNPSPLAFRQWFVWPQKWLENQPSVPCSSNKRRRRFSPRTWVTWCILPSAWAMKWYCWWAGNPGI